MSQTSRTGTIIDRMLADHFQIKALFSDVMFVRPENRGDVFCQLVTGIVGHEVAEEVVVYPEVRAAARDGADVIAPRLHEQATAEQMLADMEALDPLSPEFSEAVAELSIAVLRHAEAEERSIFPVLRAHDSSDALFELGERYEKAKRLAPTHPHPHAPDAPPANKVLGPIAALYDRVRDALGSI